MALRRCVPVIALVSEPGQAISSRIVRFKPGLDRSIVEYIEFFNYVAKNLDRLILVTFDEIVHGTAESFQRFSRDAKIDIGYDSLERTRQRVLDRMHHWSE